MKEDFLAYIWKHKLVQPKDLVSTQNEKIIVQNAGLPNSDAGPDFLQAKVKIDDTIWAGHVELHVRSSDWVKHKHSGDKNYDNVILHVVYEDDQPLKLKGQQVPTLELKGKIPVELESQYKALIHHKGWVPCEAHLGRFDEFEIKQGLHRLLVERLESKTKDIELRLKNNKNDWEETLYQLTARNFGLKVNSQPFDELAQSLSQKVIAKYKNNLTQVEALLFGQAGYLDEEYKDDYPNALKAEYQFLKQKHRLSPIPKYHWKFLRLRPPNFPTVRLAQFANLLHQSSHLFSKVLDTKRTQQLIGLFKAGTSAYWETHYQFDTPSVKRKKEFGTSAIHTLLINTVAPILFVYGREQGDESLQERAFQMLESISSEKNSIINKWREIGVNANNSFESQALLQLKNEHCSKINCLNCHIGYKILGKHVG